MIRLNLVNHYLGYFDTADQDPSDKYLRESCDLALELLNCGFNHKGLGVSNNNFTYHCEKIRKHCCHLGWIFELMVVSLDISAKRWTELRTRLVGSRRGGSRSKQ